jgi:outer membrane biosynthesis protein TonB
VPHELKLEGSPACPHIVPLTVNTGEFAVVENLSSVPLEFIEHLNASASESIAAGSAQTFVASVVLVSRGSTDIRLSFGTVDVALAVDSLPVEEAPVDDPASEPVSEPVDAPAEPVETPAAPAEPVEPAPAAPEPAPAEPTEPVPAVESPAPTTEPTPDPTPAPAAEPVPAAPETPETAPAEPSAGEPPAVA